MIDTSIKASNYNFPDKRLANRFEKVVSSLGVSLTSTIPQVFLSKKQVDATYNFFRNQKVDLTGIFEEHRQSLVPLIKSSTRSLSSATDVKHPNRILWLSDTLELDYRNKRNAAVLGPLTSLKRRGLYIHNGLVANVLGTPLGLGHQKYIIRTDEDWAKSEERKYDPIETKESIRWIEDCEYAQTLVEQLQEDSPVDGTPYEVIHITDREGDINELFQTRQQPNLHQIIRAQHNRVLVRNNKGKTIKVKEHLSKLPVAEYQTIKVSTQTTKRVRDADVTIKFSSIKIKMRKGFGAKYYKANNITPPNRPYSPSIKIQIVQVKELHPPDGIEAINWILFTTLPVDELCQALEVAQYYKNRWIIERFHYLLKSGGAQVEELNFKRNLQLKNALVAYSLAAMDVLRIKYLAEKQPDLPIDQTGILPIQHEVLYNYVHQYVDKKIQYVPDEIPTIKDFCIVLGKLTGFRLSKKNPLPGLKILTRSWIQLDTIVKSYKLSCQRTDE